MYKNNVIILYYILDFRATIEYKVFCTDRDHPFIITLNM